MQDKNQKQNPLFAEIRLGKEGRNSKQTQKPNDQRFQYIKLSYPNGVVLTLPVGVPSEILESYIRIKI